MDFVSKMPIVGLIFCFCTDSDFNGYHGHVTLFIASMVEIIVFDLSFLLFLNEQCRRDGPVVPNAWMLSGFLSSHSAGIYTNANELLHTSYPSIMGRTHFQLKLLGSTETFF